MLLDGLTALSRQYGRRIVMSTHPRTRKRLTALAPRARGRRPIEFLKPFGFFDWVKLQMNAACVLSDSGTLTEEAALLGFPAVMIREAHERPEGMDAGVCVMSGLRRGADPAGGRAGHRAGAGAGGEVRVPDYGDADVSRKVVRIVSSYVDYIQRTTWYAQPATTTPTPAGARARRRRLPRIRRSPR